MNNAGINAPTTLKNQYIFCDIEIDVQKFSFLSFDHLDPPNRKQDADRLKFCPSYA
jgi:hypothetical protein